MSYLVVTKPSPWSDTALMAPARTGLMRMRRKERGKDPREQGGGAGSQAVPGNHPSSPIAFWTPPKGEVMCI